MNLRAILRIAQWEAARQATGLDRRTVLFVLLAVLLSSAAVFLGGDPTVVDDGLYTVGIESDSPYEDALSNYGPTTPVVIESTQVARERVQRGAVDALLESDGGVTAHDSEKGRAAVAAVRSAVERYNADQLQAETDQSAAYPVVVSVTLIEQRSNALNQQAASGSGGAVGVTDENRAVVEQEADSLASEPFEGTLPTELRPPFPFQSLILAFLFIIPMNFVVQSFASSVIDERLNRRGELLLVSPVTPADIVIGKTLPYALTLVLFISVTSLAIGVGSLSVAALAPLALAYLGAGFLAGVFARSYQELTFVVLSVSLFFTAFAFIPAIFTSVNPIAAISPLSVVVKQLEADPVTTGEFAFATLPLLLSGVLMFVLGLGVYTEEALFTQRSVPAKVLDALATQLRSSRTLFVVSAVSIPFVFAAELLVVAGLFIVPQAISIPVLLALLAIVEEIAKSIAIYAGFQRKVLANTTRVALVAGALSGFGFFLAEKVFVIGQTVGLFDLTLGQIAFENSVLLGGTGSPIAIIVLILFPILHSITAAVAALGARRGFAGYLVGLVVAVLIHVTYNLMAVSISV